jgi:hypothetical protein
LRPAWHKKTLAKKKKSRRALWTHLIPATQEAEIRRIAVQSQPQANGSQDPVSEISNRKKSW